MLKYSSGVGVGVGVGGGGGGGGRARFLHENQPPSYIMNTINHNYANTLSKVSKTMPKLISFSFHFLLFEPSKPKCLVCDGTNKPKKFFSKSAKMILLSPL